MHIFYNTQSRWRGNLNNKPRARTQIIISFPLSRKTTLKSHAAFYHAPRHPHDVYVISPIFLFQPFPGSQLHSCCSLNSLSTKIHIFFFKYCLSRKLCTIFAPTQIWIFFKLLQKNNNKRERTFNFEERGHYTGYVFWITFTFRPH